MSLIEWFRTKFIPNCSDKTVAALIFLFNKYNNELLESEDAKNFIADLCEQYSKPTVGLEEVEIKHE